MRHISLGKLKLRSVVKGRSEVVHAAGCCAKVAVHSRIDRVICPLSDSFIKAHTCFKYQDFDKCNKISH